MRPPTKRQAALAARQLHYHRERLVWIRDRMRDNESLLLLYLTGLEDRAAVLPGGYRISGENASASQSVEIEKLAPESPYEQLELLAGGRETARETPSRGPRPTNAGREKPGGRTPSAAARTEEAPAYEERECGRCFGGAIHVGGPTEVRTSPCPDCRGTGKVLCFLYPRPKGRRGPWPPQQEAAAEGRSAGDAS
jgi:hypothetical protein